MVQVPALDWSKLGTYSATSFPHGWSPDAYVFFSPRDPGVHQAILDVVNSATHRVMVNMYGYDDDELDAALHTKAADPQMSFTMNLDKSQAGGVHERVLTQPWASAIGTSVAVGTSIHKAISHLKVCVVDGQYTISGSTNWSLSGEQKQDNELTITRDPLRAVRFESVILLNHASMLAQMVAKPHA